MEAQGYALDVAGHPSDAVGVDLDLVV